MKKILYVNHKKRQCGIYEFGRNVGNALLNIGRFKLKYCECDSFRELKNEYDLFKPDIIIYNYHITTMNWIYNIGRYKYPITYLIDAIHIGTIHEVYQELVDQADTAVFDFHIASDPTLLLKNPIVYKTGRLLLGEPRYTENNSSIPAIGSFGFASPGKGFEKIIKHVQDEFDEAVINLNIPFSSYGDKDGEKARELANECRSLISKSKITLNVTHDYLVKEDLENFLAANSINVFLYDDEEGRGISSTPDAAIVSGRPLAISKSRLFRHLFHCDPSICVEDSNLKQILDNGIVPIKHLWKEWNAESLIWDYERILDDILIKKQNKEFKNRQFVKFILKKSLTKLGLLKHQKPVHNVWTNTKNATTHTNNKRNGVEYTPLTLPSNSRLNCILDNDARKLYKPAEIFLQTYLPELIARKIPEANVQQAFVLDTCIRLAEKFANPAILAVGSFEDTAVEGLKLLNYKMADIDPIFNYNLHTYTTKPGINGGTYDIIVSTSVIEHVENDEQFVKDIEYLLAKGGYAVLTCDYNDQYKKGDDIPTVDYRFYTMYDLKERLMKAIPNCKLVDEPKWECNNPDFFYEGKYQYTFASLVFQKIS